MHANVWRVISGVSETIRGIPLAEDQTALGKLEIRAVERRYSVPLPKFCEKNCFSTPNFSQIGRSAAELLPKTIFNTAAVRHFQF